MYADLLPDRILERIEVSPSGCWLWTAGKSGDGYGAQWHDGRVQRAHRVTYQLLVGPIADGLELDHLCRVPACVNVDHLEPVTHAENMRRSPGKSGTTCPQGHEYDEVDQWNHGRRCSICRRAFARERQRRYRARKAAG